MNGTPVLPLNVEHARLVALIGPLADDGAQMVGSWGGKSTAKDVTTLRGALEDSASAKRWSCALRERHRDTGHL